MRSHAADDDNSRPFLATTAREDFWDTTGPVLFLGEWCLKFDRRAAMHDLRIAGVVPNPYKDAELVQHALKRAGELVERTLTALGVRLNALHGIEHAPRSWRILLGPWLQLYISTAYDRYLHIKHAQQSNPGFTTLLLSEKSFTVPRDTLEFACLLSEDTYNLQLISKLLVALGGKFPDKAIDASPNTLYGKLSGSSWKYRAASKTLSLVGRLSSALRPTVLLRTTYLPRQVEMKLAIKSFGRILPVLDPSSAPEDLGTDDASRRQLQDLDLGDGEFEMCLARMLPSDLPLSFVERFDEIGRAASKIYPKRVRAAFSANAWYYDEAFKRAAARYSEQGSLLLGTQHGGNYGALLNMPSEDHETAIVDRYYSWGWQRKDCRAEVVAMPASKLVGRKPVGVDNDKQGILWVATSASRYLSQYPFVPSQFRDYLDWQRRFAESLPPRLMPAVRFRPHYEDYGWGITERLKSSVPDIRIESWQEPFTNSLENCRLYVCDHLSTTFVEALSANKPAILFWNPASNELRPDARPFYDALRESGILFDTPEAAASAADLAYDDVESWWLAPQRQRAVDRFCKQFARTSDDALALWNAEMRRVSEQPFSLKTSTC